MTPPKILIVDDEPFNIDYLEQELEELDYLTISAANGQEALAQVHAETPDLVLLDIMMPIMDGFQVLTRIKANPATRHIPVIVISALDNLQSVVRGIEMGAEDYLPKPFEPTLLHARISSSLEKKRLRDLEQQYLQSLERELEIGRQIQLGFLPDALPDLAGWEIAAYFKAAREVSGDFYDAFLLPDGNLAFVVGDVCGKGVGAALFMTLFRSLIRATATSEYFGARSLAQPLTPSERLQRVIAFTNNYVAEIHNAASMFATVFAGLVDLQSSTLSYINGGNEPALLLRAGASSAGSVPARSGGSTQLAPAGPGAAQTGAAAFPSPLPGEMTALWPTGPIVGVIPEAQYAVRQVTLQPGDLLLAFSDGITDALNPENEAFGRERVRQCLHASPASPTALLDEIQHRLQAFIGSAHQFDDITLLAVGKR